MPDFKYPLPKFHFELEWGGTRLGFTEVTGLDFETEVIEYREGNLPSYNKTKQPGLTKYTDVTLKRGIILDDLEYFTQWEKTAMFQEIKEKYRRTVTIKLLNEEHKRSEEHTSELQSPVHLVCRLLLEKKKKKKKK